MNVKAVVACPATSRDGRDRDWERHQSADCLRSHRVYRHSQISRSRVSCLAPSGDQTSGVVSELAGVVVSSSAPCCDTMPR